MDDRERLRIVMELSITGFMTSDHEEKRQKLQGSRTEQIVRIDA